MSDRRPLSIARDAAVLPVVSFVNGASRFAWRPDSAQTNAIASLLERLPPERRRLLDDCDGQRRRGVIFASLARLDLVAEIRGWKRRDLAAALDVQPNALSNWFKSGEVNPVHRVRIRNLLLANGLAGEPTAIQAAHWIERTLVCWIQRHVIEMTTPDRPHLDEIEHVFLRHAMQAGWSPTTSIECTFARLPSPLRELFPDRDSRWFVELLNSFGQAMLLMLWKETRSERE